MLTRSCFPSLQQFDAAFLTNGAAQLTDDQWFLIKELFPWNPPLRAGGRRVAEERSPGLRQSHRQRPVARAVGDVRHHADRAAAIEKQNV